MLKKELKEFRSDTSNDIVEINYTPKLHKSNFVVKQYDNFMENIKLVHMAVNFLKGSNIKWVWVQSGEYYFPPNTVWYKHKKNGNIHCHIEDFEKFYLHNMNKLIKFNKIYVEDKINDDGWTTIVDKNKLRKDKMNNIKLQIKNLTEDWSKY